MKLSQQPESLLAAWSNALLEDACVAVLPDGCRDLIVRLSPGRPPRWFVSPLMDTVQRVDCRAGERYLGYRLRPGAVIDEAGILSVLEGDDGIDFAGISELIDDFCRLDGRLAEALDCLSWSDSVAGAARDLGVSERSLERLVITGSGRRPIYWKRLARARRAASAVSEHHSLAAVAQAHGYADQAHMSRDFRCWFGLPPDLFRRNPALVGLVRQSGYGQALTGVHISTRKPSGSAT